MSDEPDTTFDDFDDDPDDNDGIDSYAGALTAAVAELDVIVLEPGEVRP